MLNVLWEISIPLVISFAIGVGVGWLLWRWRRTPISDREWQLLTDRAATAEQRLSELAEAHGAGGTGSVPRDPASAAGP